MGRSIETGAKPDVLSPGMWPEQMTPLSQEGGSEDVIPESVSKNFEVLVVQPDLHVVRDTHAIDPTPAAIPAPKSVDPELQAAIAEIGAEVQPGAITAKKTMENSLANLINAQRIAWACNTRAQELQGLRKYKAPDGKEYLLKVEANTKRKLIDDLMAVKADAMVIWKNEQDFLGKMEAHGISKKFWTDVADQLAMVSFPAYGAIKIFGKKQDQKADKPLVEVSRQTVSAQVGDEVGLGPVGWVILAAVTLVSLGMTAKGILEAVAHASQARANVKANENAGAKLGTVDKLTQALIAGKIKPEDYQKAVTAVQKTETAPGSPKADEDKGKGIPTWAYWVGGALLVGGAVYLLRKTPAMKAATGAAKTALSKVRAVNRGLEYGQA